MYYQLFSIRLSQRDLNSLNIVGGERHRFEAGSFSSDVPENVHRPFGKRREQQVSQCQFRKKLLNIVINAVSIVHRCKIFLQGWNSYQFKLHSIFLFGLKLLNLPWETIISYSLIKQFTVWRSSKSGRTDWSSGMWPDRWRIGGCSRS